MIKCRPDLLEIRQNYYKNIRIYNNGGKRIFLIEESYNFLSKLSIIIGFELIVIGLLVSSIIPLSLVTFIASFGIGLISIGLAFHSIQLSKKSDDKLVSLAEESNEKIRDVANMHFKEILDIFEDRRISLIKQIRSGNFAELASGIWQCRSTLRWAHSSIKWIDIELQYKLSKEVMELIKALPWDKKKSMTNNDVNNVLNMYGMILELKISRKTHKKLNDVLVSYLGKKKNSKMKSFIKKKRTELKSKRHHEYFSKN